MMLTIKRAAEELWRQPGVIDCHRINVWVDRVTLTKKQKYHDEGEGLFRLKRVMPRYKKAKP